MSSIQFILLLVLEFSHDDGPARDIGLGLIRHSGFKLFDRANSPVFEFDSVDF